ncbi:MAG: phosphotransferase, partial [Planctomycetes bacterium]|nr:phosphotransferase [Planctomycetota bacterium]
LLDDQGLRLPEWLQSGQARIVKQGPHRIVYRVELPGLCFYVKHNFIHDQRAWFRQLVRQSKARIEYDRVVAAAERGIPTITPLALAEQETQIGSGESILITQSLEDCMPLHFFLAAVLPTFPEPRASRLRQRLATELGRLVARVHEAGILHHDLHAGNILVRVVDGDRVELFVIDLLSVKMGPPLDWTQSRENLVMINCWFTLRVHRADRLRFWKAYFEARKLGVWRRDQYGTKLYAKELHDIEELSWQRNLRFWQRRDKRCLHNCRYYRKVHGPGVAGHAVMEIADADLAELLNDPDAPFQHASPPSPCGREVGGEGERGSRVLKQSASSTVIEMDFRVNGQLRRVIFKRFRVTSWTDPLASLFRAPPALRSWIHGQGFRERGLPTARPFVVLHRRSYGLWHEGYLMTEKIAHADDLHATVERLEAAPTAARVRLVRRLIERVARTIRSLHQREMSHRDLKAANILVRRWDAPDDEPSAYSQDIQNLLYMPESAVWLIDLVGVEVFAELPRSRKVQNLARLNASFFESDKITRTDRLRFLLAYLHCGAFGRCDWKSWWKEIDWATLKKVDRNKRSGKPLQ